MSASNSRRQIVRVALFAVIFPTSISCWGDDWPQWRGPMRDGIWRESGLVAELPAGELPVRWRVPVTYGYSGPAVAAGKVYLFEYDVREGQIKNNPGGTNELQGLERLRCLDSASGDELWRHEYDRPYNVSYASGPRCTPTVDGDRVYTLGTEGDLKCLQTSDGSVVWSKSFSEDYGAKTPHWGHSAHPLVDGGTVYCVVGGEGSVAVAFDKLTGKEKWKALTSHEPGYCPPCMLEIGGKRQLIIFHPTAVNGLDPTDGTVLWSVPIESSYGMSIAQPLRVGTRLFASGYNASVCFGMSSEAKEPTVYWAGSPKTSISSANATPISDGEVIYGTDANASALVAVDPSTGDRIWQSKVPVMGEGKRGRHGTVFIVRQAETNRYWLFNELGDLILARLSPAGYEEIGRKHLIDATGEAFGRSVVWNHPAFAERAVFVRNDKELICVDLSGD